MKPWYMSRTLWVNIIAIVVLVAQMQFGFEVDEEAELAILAVINLIMRIITKQPLTT